MRRRIVYSEDGRLLTVGGFSSPARIAELPWDDLKGGSGAVTSVWGFDRDLGIARTT